MMQRSSLATWSLSIGLAVVFVFFGVDKFVHPTVWIGWIPTWMDGIARLTANGWLQIIGLFEILCAVLVLIPRRSIRKIGALLMTIQILLILPIAGLNDIGIRDFGLLMSALALAVLL